MLRPVLLWFLLTLLLVPSAAGAQNPFLQNQGRRTITSIEFDGYERTKLYVLERELGFAEGDDYDPGAVNDAWTRLEQLPFIAYVEIQTERPSPGEAELRIHVVEEPIFVWQLGVDYSRRLDSQWYGDVRLGTVNAFGRGERLEFQVDAWALRQARLRWSNPWLFGAAHLGVYVDVGAFNHDWVYTPAPDANTTEFALESGVQREFGPGFHAALAARWRYRELDDLDPALPDGSFGGATPVGQRSIDTDERALLVTVGFDNRDSHYYPSRGIDASVDLALASLSDEFENYSTIDLSLAAFAPVPWLHTIGAYVTERIAPDPLPWYERTYFGGPMDLRGVEFGSDRGDEHLRASIEVRRPVFVVPLRGGRSIGLGAHAFSDWGAAWETDRNIGDQQFSHSFGLGAHFNFNTYNYRFEWARVGDENFFVFEDHFTF